jgi:transcriptional regulator with XRE-family HTH domain
LAENKKFREARKRTASLTCPDVCLSRQELAELANTWIWKHHEKMAALSANYIGQLERGKIRWPGKLYRETLRAILSVSTDAALGFVNTRRSVVKLEDEDVKRRQAIHTVTGLGVGALVLEGPVAALLEISEPTPIPRRIGATDIEQIRTTTRVFSTGTSLTAAGWPGKPSWASCAGRLDCWTLPARTGYAPSCSPPSALLPAALAAWPLMSTPTKTPVACSASRWRAPSRPTTGTYG